MEPSPSVLKDPEAEDTGRGGGQGEKAREERWARLQLHFLHTLQKAVDALMRPGLDKKTGGRTSHRWWPLARVGLRVREHGGTGLEYTSLRIYMSSFGNHDISVYHSDRLNVHPRRGISPRGWASAATAEARGLRREREREI